MFALIMTDIGDSNLLAVGEEIVVFHISGDVDVGAFRNSVLSEERAGTATQSHVNFVFN